MDKDLARAFTLAREEIRSGRQWYICVALQQLYHKRQIPGLEYERARALIQQRLGHDNLGRWTINVEAWLIDNVDDFDRRWRQGRVADQELVDYRVRWLDSLIAEFS